MTRIAVCTYQISRKLVRCRTCGNLKGTIGQAIKQAGEAITCHCGRRKP